MFIDTTSGIQLEYLAEGAANVVYKIIVPPPSPSTAADADIEEYEYPPSEITPLLMDPGLEGKLIRVRKATSSGVTVHESYKHYEKNIAPLFPQEKDRVEHILFKPSRTLLEDLNGQLKAMEVQATRPKKRHGTYLAEDEEYGLLVTDMSCSNPSNAAFRCFEFKPKWLVQSPSAPANAVRCRTCALRHLRRSQDHKTSTIGAKSDFCPLGLVSKEKALVGKSVERITGLDPNVKVMSADDETMRRHLIDHIYLNPLLGHLSEMQRNWDPFGVMNSDDFMLTHALSVAMTLRDCTLFLKVNNL